MPMREFLYHGHAVAVTGQITSPASHTIEDHARCSLPDRGPGHHHSSHTGHHIPDILSHGPCRTEVHAMKEDDGYFRTEVQASLESFDILGESPLHIARMSMGLVSVYRRHWYDNGTPHATRVRVLPLEWDFGGLIVDGRPAGDYLPAPFRYPAGKREAYLRADHPDPAIEAEIQTAIDGSASRSVHIPNFGRIYFGEWTLGGDGASPHVHRITMLRLALGSPIQGAMSLLVGEGDGGPPPRP